MSTHPFARHVMKQHGAAQTPVGALARYLHSDPCVLPATVDREAVRLHLVRVFLNVTLPDGFRSVWAALDAFEDAWAAWAPQAGILLDYPGQEEWFLARWMEQHHAETRRRERNLRRWGFDVDAHE